MLAKEVMKTNVECCTPEQPAHIAARQMRERNVGFLPVCDEAGKVVGAITDRDLAIRLVADSLPATTPVSQVMTREVVFCGPDDDLREAEKKMAEHQKSRMICIDDQQQLVGVISLSDIARRDEPNASRTLRQVAQREARGS